MKKKFVFSDAFPQHFLIWVFRGKWLLMKGMCFPWDPTGRWGKNIQAFEARGAMSGQGSRTPTAASSREIRSSSQRERCAHRTTQIKTFISLLTFISRSVLWAKNGDRQQTDRQTWSSLWLWSYPFICWPMSTMACRVCDPVSALH